MRNCRTDSDLLRGQNQTLNFLLLSFRFLTIVLVPFVASMILYFLFNMFLVFPLLSQLLLFVPWNNPTPNMNHCAILSNAFSGHEEMRTSVPCPISDFRDQLVCPKPRRLTVNAHSDTSLRWNLRFFIASFLSLSLFLFLIQSLLLSSANSSWTNFQSPSWANRHGRRTGSPWLPPDEGTPSSVFLWFSSTSF